ncbi:hypothetical protein LP420_36975 [Massilia sp. B-10]|nr:hypothetical protein LP420_36975 [Massilia sp. B-10]
MTANALLLTELDNVSNRVVELRHADGRWQRRTVASPGFGSLEVAAEDPYGSDHYFMTVNDFLTPTTLYLASVGSDARSALKSMLRPGSTPALPGAPVPGAVARRHRDPLFRRHA